MTSTLSRALKHAAAFAARLETAAGITPRTLYLSRNVLNAQEIADWYAGQGLTDLRPDLFHVTVAYSKTPVNWFRVGSDYYGESIGHSGSSTPATEVFPPGSMVVNGGPRLHERFGPDGKENALVLIFPDSGLKYRNERVRDVGGSWDFPDYIPHITIAYDEDGKVDWNAIKPFAGRIVFGPEIWAEVNEDWKADNGLEKAEVEEAKSLAWYMFKGAATSLDGSNVPLDNGHSFGVMGDTIYLNNPKGGKMIKVAAGAKRIAEILKLSEKAKGNMAFGKKRGVTAALEAASVNPRKTGVAAALEACRPFSQVTAAGTFAPGDKVEVESDDGEWYPATVKGVKGNKVSLVYDGEKKAYSIPAKWVRAKAATKAPPKASPPPAPKTYTRDDFTDAQFKLATKAWTTINDKISAFGEKKRMKVYEVHHLFQTIRPRLMEAVIDGETDHDRLVRDALNSVKLGDLADPEPADNNIGRSWPNGRGVTRRITGKIMVNGEERYTVRDDDQTGKFGEEIVRPDELEDRIAQETRLAESNKTFREQQDRQQAERDTREAELRSLDGFEDTFTTPMARERAIKTLTQSGGLKVSGRFYQSRKAAIRDLVLRKGYRLGEINGKRRLISPDGSFYDDKVLTKIGFDYAEHLSKGGGQ